MRILDNSIISSALVPKLGVNLTSIACLPPTTALGRVLPAEPKLTRSAVHQVAVVVLRRSIGPEPTYYPEFLDVMDGQDRVTEWPSRSLRGEYPFPFETGLTRGDATFYCTLE